MENQWFAFIVTQVIAIAVVWFGSWINSRFANAGEKRQLKSKLLQSVALMFSMQERLIDIQKKYAVTKHEHRDTNAMFHLTATEHVNSSSLLTVLESKLVQYQLLDDSYQYKLIEQKALLISLASEVSELFGSSQGNRIQVLVNNINQGTDLVSKEEIDKIIRQINSVVN